MKEYLEHLGKLKGNRYEQVIVASKYARFLNRRIEKQKLEGKNVETEGKSPAKLGTKIVAQALKALVNGEIDYDVIGENKGNL